MLRLSLALTLLTSTARATPRPVFDLVANRLLSHALDKGGLTIAAGSPGFAKYVHFSRPLPTWHLRATEDGRPVALAETHALLDVPLGQAELERHTLTMRLKSPVRQTVRATVNGKPSLNTATTLVPGWQTVSLTLPKEALSDGENRIVLSFTESGPLGGRKAAAAVDWIAFAGGQEAPAKFDGALVLRKDGGLVYYVQVPRAGSFRAQGDLGGCSVRLTAKAQGQPPLAANVASGAAVDLAPLGGQVARLELSAEGPTCRAARLTQAALYTEGSAPLARPAERPRNVVFWMTDDTRSDKYRLYNPKTRVETPVFDELAKRSTLFHVAYVQGNESRVSHASLWTSMYPAQHHFIAEKAKLDLRFVTLPEAIQLAGLFTAGFMANGFIDAFWGFGQGWDLLHNYIHEKGGGLLAADLVRVGRSFLSERGRKPFFLYLGTIDAHVSWRAHQPWIGKYDQEPYSGPYAKACLDPQLDQIVAGKPISERDKRRIVALYDSDVSYNDQQLGELLRTLEESGHRDDTMIVFTADHGEELWDHGKVGHGQSLREELVHVPLLIYYPPLFPAGKVIEEGAEIVDLLPTIADALGTKAPAGAQGESLIPLALGENEGYPRPAIASQYELAHTMRLGRWKLWVGGSGEVRLYDLSADPAEVRELGQARPFERRFVSDAMSLWIANQGRWKKARWGVASNALPALAADLDP